MDYDTCIFRYAILKRRSRMRKLLWKIKNSVCNEEGITTVEVILLLVDI